MIASFGWTTERLSHAYSCIHSPLNSPPVQVATSHRAEFPVLDGRSLLVIHFKYSSVYMSISNSLSPGASRLLILPGSFVRLMHFLVPITRFFFFFYLQNHTQLVNVAVKSRILQMPFERSC